VIEADMGQQLLPPFSYEFLQRRLLSNNLSFSVEILQSSVDEHEAVYMPSFHLLHALPSSEKNVLPSTCSQ
jgi:hypothetical protein